MRHRDLYTANIFLLRADFKSFKGLIYFMQTQVVTLLAEGLMTFMFIQMTTLAAYGKILTSYHGKYSNVLQMVP